ncbi:sugar O-acyltransferase (sialic acid O-acetyltransferase NeuD family) [Flavobacterium arsenatis]|uniref:Sugar O-acyltransferase (Sialic acid O-acetyltransferase NeuD family) n=1 Tax=Flavobacterium arsenatis TaxID=1484332 RepID=A0ABU1TS99_9FLAO|nr:acetyltransferase [Flavobacterium arsenatis]MDR6968753.1 sugar O-acyltransferase (sialic acid O-acetyltransferase NeuD family) [Flavobacterium arsenatis]
MNKVLAILGAGELGKQIANFALIDKHYSKVIFYDDFNIDKEIKGNTNDLVNDFNSNFFDELIIGIGYNHLKAREEKFNFLKDKIKFGKIIHSTSWVDKSANIQDGCVIYPKCAIDKKVIIKHNTILNLNCTIAHDTIIGSSCFLAPSVSIAGFCLIEEECFIGINASIKDNITIVNEATIGAGTVVVKNIIKKGLYVGNPAKFIR